MGLDTTHGCWHGPYSSFGAFRDEVARAAGVPFNEKGWYAVPDEYCNDAYCYGHIGREGDARPTDVIWVLLAHSDCDGRIPTRFCAELADRLEAIDVADEHKESLSDFVNGLRDAADCGDDVIFG